MNDSPAPSAVPPPLPPDFPQPAVPGRSRWRWWVHLSILTLLPLLALLSTIPGVESTGPALGRSTRGLLVVSAVQLFFFAVIFGLAWVFSRATWDDLLLRWRGGLWPLPLSVAYSIALRLAVGIAVMIPYAVFM